MPTFAYQARNRAGEAVAGEREAPDRRAALEALRELGLFVTQLAPAPQRSAREIAAERSRAERIEAAQPAAWQPVPPSTVALSGAAPPSAAPSPEVALRAPAQVERHLWARAGAKEMALFYRQMHAMLHAGTSLWHALRTLGQHAASPPLRRAAAEMSDRLTQGQTWSQAMRAYPGLFSELAVGMVSAGETGGFLDRMCLRLAEYSERDYDLQQMVKRETWYPKLLVFCSILIPSVVPLVLAVVNGGNALAAWLNAVLWPLLAVGGVWGAWKLVNYLSPVAARSGSPRYLFDLVKLQLPIVGKTARALATVKFSRALGALYAAGVAPQKAVVMAADACGNAVIAEKSRRLRVALENGAGLTESLASTGQFPGVALQMLRTGEETGAVDEQLGKVADFLEQDAETTIRQSIKVLGIVVFLVMAVYIGSMVIQSYVGYFDTLLDEAEK